MNKELQNGLKDYSAAQLFEAIIKEAEKDPAESLKPRVLVDVNSLEPVQLIEGDCHKILAEMEPGFANLVTTRPPCNIGKANEENDTLLMWANNQMRSIDLAMRALQDGGSICWQVGNVVNAGEVIPLDSFIILLMRAAGLKIRNRIVWQFGHGLHCKHRLSGRYETIIWATMGDDDYTFNLDPIRVPQKFPGKKHYKGPKKGQLSGNPLGKNPGDIWDITNIKHNHPEKTAHPCQTPEELISRLVKSLTNPGDLIIDPYAGSGTAGVVAKRLGRRAILIERNSDYVEIARVRLGLNLGDPI